MGVEVLAPDAITANSSNASGAVTDVDEPVDGPDSNWIVATTEAFIQCRFSFPTPASTPQTGADFQKVRVWVRRHDNSTLEPKLTIKLYNGSTLHSTILSSVGVSSATGETHEATFDASDLTLSDGSDCEIRVEGARSGGAVAERNAMDIGAVEWVVQNGVAPSLGISFHGA